MPLGSLLVFLASQCAPRLSSRVLASSGYSRNLNRLGPPEAFTVWGIDTAHRQEDAWRSIIEAAKRGQPREDVGALYAALQPFAGSSANLLEAGCGGGHNSELIAARYPEFHYSGIDISPSMIEIARNRYPEGDFAVDNSYELASADRSVDIVLDGVALIHMSNWRTALREYARASRGHVILHGLTLTDAAPTTPFVKYAYGQPTMELVFNRSDVRGECDSLGLKQTASYRGLDYDLRHYLGIPSVSETWVLGVTDAA
jgi:SAM-dependent methyltransferase